MSVFTPLINRLAGYFGYVPADGGVEQPSATARAAAFAERELWYSNRLYLTRAAGGMLEDVLSLHFGVAGDEAALPRHRIAGHFNPVGEIVDFYQHVLPGAWGTDIKPAPAVDGRPVNPALLARQGDAADPLTRLWRWSNLDTAKAELLRQGANLGTVGLRVVARTDDDPARRRVTVQFDHPARVADWDEDDRGNVTEVLLRYTVPRRDELGDESTETIEVEERLSRTRFSLTYDGVEQLDAAARVNQLGVCPYVILRHAGPTAGPGVFGRHAYQGAEPKLHNINAVLSAETRSVKRHAFPQWFGAAGGPKPTSYTFGEDSVIYVKTDAESPVPVFTPLVPPIDFAGITEYTAFLRDMIRQSQPELNLNDLKVLGGTSGETLQQALKPAEQKIAAARPRYDDALVRALKLGLSEGVRLALWDLGAGTGTPEAAEASFARGLEDFVLDDRPLLPETAAQKLVNAQARTSEVDARVTEETEQDSIASARAARRQAENAANSPPRP